MKKWLVLLIAIVLSLASNAGAADIVATFGASMVPCVLAATKASITADGVDSTVVTLTSKGVAISTPVTVENQRNEQQITNFMFPAGGVTLTASQAGDWLFVIVSPIYNCNQLEISAH